MIRRRLTSLIGSLATAALLTLPAPSAIAAPATPCEHLSRSTFPDPQPQAPSGSEFLRSIASLDADGRETAIRNELMAGDIPPFLRELVPVALDSRAADGQTVHAVVCVMPDYLAVGSDRDYFLTPMQLGTALTVADRYGFLLPTSKIVDAIYQQAQVKLGPQPLPASDAMRSTPYYRNHNELVGEQRRSQAAPLGALTAGDKKDLVITTRLWTHLQRVAIYGWHKLDGLPIQPLSTVHGWHYADYSHGVRLVAATAFVDGQPRSLLDLLGDRRLAPLFSSEGSIPDLARLLDLLRLQPLELGNAGSIAS